MLLGKERGASGMDTMPGPAFRSPITLIRMNPGANTATSMDRKYQPMNSTVTGTTKFFPGWLGPVTDRQPSDPARFARIQVRALTGVGAERGSHS